MDQPQTTPNPTRRQFVAGVAAASVGIAATSPASAQTYEGFFDEQTVGGRLWASGSYVVGFGEGIVAELQTSTSSIDSHVDAAEAEFDDHTDDWLTWVNDRNLGGPDAQTLHLSFEYERESRERYVIADWDGDQYDSVTIEPSYDGAADYEATLRDRAVENAADELAVIHDRYIAPNNDVDRSHFARLAGRYRIGPDKHISATFLGGL